MEDGIWGFGEGIILRKLLSLWMDDITHYNLNEMSDYDAWNLLSWTEIEWPKPPSKQYILSKTKQVKYPFVCFFFPCSFNITLFTNSENLQHNPTSVKSNNWLAALTLRSAHITTNALSWSKQYSRINIHSQQ
jgi:hypothetical protein